MHALVDVNEAAKQTGLSVYELRKGARSGKYPVYHCGRKCMYDVEQLQSIILEEMNPKDAQERRPLALVK